MLISLLRQLCILVPLGYVLAIYTSMGLKGYWAAFPIAEALSVAIFLPIALKTIKTIFEKKAALTNEQIEQEEIREELDEKALEEENTDTVA